MEWADWSTPMAAMQLIQSSLLGVAMEEADRHEAIVVAGPVVELLPLAEVFEMAARRLNSAGRLVGVIPCLRDNSPESQLFMDLAAEQLWPYCVAEELMVIVRVVDAGLIVTRADMVEKGLECD